MKIMKHENILKKKNLIFCITALNTGDIIDKPIHTAYLN